MSEDSSIDFWKKKLAESEQLRLLQGIEIQELWQYVLELLERTDEIDNKLTNLAANLEFEDDEGENEKESFM